jgi:outer membrane protein assembly factor BamA
MGHFESSNLDRPGNPTRGYNIRFNSGYYKETTDDKYGFTRFQGDFSKFIHLFYERVLVLRCAAEINRQLKDMEIPFYYLSELGNKESIRGFERGRFRDRDKFLVSAEYRYPVWRLWKEQGLDMVLFADAGQISNNIFDNVAIGRLEPGFGMGVRFWNEDGLAAKVEAGRSDDGWRIYFVLN